jgi:hypothetical protein
MFMHGPAAHFELVFRDIPFRYVTSIEPPGFARITGGSCLPSNEKAVRPVLGSSTAESFTGECPVGGSVTFWPRAMASGRKKSAMFEMVIFGSPEEQMHSMTPGP